MSGISLSTILQIQPDIWSYADYAGRNCVTIQLNKYNNAVEYNEIESFVESNLGLDSLSIRKIERVQHPIAYGRFLLRKQQLERRNRCIYTPTREFCAVPENKVKEALEYNLDKRRVNISSSLLHIHGDSNCFILTKRLRSSKSRDSEEYPEYVIYYD